MPHYDEHADVLGDSEASLAGTSIGTGSSLIAISTPTPMHDDAGPHTGPDARITATFVLNLMGLAAICAALTFAFVVQFGRGELPCPLCLLQRLAFVMAGMGLVLNLSVGDRPMHYAVTIAAAMGGCIPSLRQIALHLHPGDPGFGSTLFGLHFYTWAFIGFAMLIMHCVLCLALMSATAIRRAHTSKRRWPPWRDGIVRGVGYAFLVLTLANAVSTTLECGLGSCPDDPVHYLWWPHESLNDLA